MNAGRAKKGKKLSVGLDGSLHIRAFYARLEAIRMEAGTLRGSFGRCTMAVRRNKKSPFCRRCMYGIMRNPLRGGLACERRF